ncbi:DUF3939 domain-containing protein [Paenibacillus hexagrammi]|uniref:DUF3939 domain-containing protein n=1 Tax=Paenibacillus hexagrammi TaxID=2908839 RepID=A0ABY3ST61_9BACL|nr:DUF3939 domain-containing protein [Paenibacillus sp. YPD9-1]UJF36196.1 DUF3939 domain-containing protein [Paenibacillus sp. YPD9-1]
MKRQLLSKQLGISVLFICLLVALSGCAYPSELRMENKINPAEFITVVQQAVDQFHEKTGVLPIKNSEMDTPLYEKYVIDFGKLQKGHFLSSVPANAFESGGIFIYVLIDVETKPQVKLMDLSAYQSVPDVQTKVDEYKMKHNGEAPVSISINDQFGYVDFDKMGMKSPEVKSSFDRQSTITYIIHKQTGTVAIDYAPDIMKLIQGKSGTLTDYLKPDQDLRKLLAAQSYFVPIKSYPYRWKDEQPIPVEE